MELLKNDIINNFNFKGVVILSIIIYSVLTIFGMESNGILKSVVLFCTFGIFGWGIYFILAFGILALVKKYIVKSNDFFRYFITGVLISFTLDCMLEVINVMLDSTIETTFTTAMNGYVSGGVVAFLVVYVASILITAKGTLIFLFLIFGFFVVSLLKDVEIISKVKKLKKKIPKVEKPKVEKPKVENPKVEKPKVEIKKEVQIPKFDLKKKVEKIPKENLKEMSDKVKGVFEAFDIKVKVEKAIEGNSISQIWISKPTGTAMSKITKLEEELSIELQVHGSVRIARIFGTSYLGVDIPKKERSNVYLSEMLGSKEFSIKTPGALDVCVGKNVIGDNIIINLATTPHCFVVGATGSGKSVAINSFIISLIAKNTPDEVKFLMIDPKMVSLIDYDNSPYMFNPVVTESKEAVKALENIVDEMERRYKIIAEAKEKELDPFNANNPNKTMPKIVVVIDELADLMEVAKDKVEGYIIRLAQKARGCGIHLILATQTPRSDVITGKIKANIPETFCFMVKNKNDSRVAIDENGAEQLLPRGDGLMTIGGGFTRFQCSFMSDKDIKSFISGINKKYKNNFIDNAIKGNHEELKKIMYNMVNKNQCGVEFVKSEYSVGYNNAKKILVSMEELGWLVTTPKGYRISTDNV